MYFFSFLKSLFQPRRFLCVIYFLANIAIIFFAFAMFNLFKLTSDVDQNMIYNGLIGLGINFVILLVTLSPIGEAMVRRKEGIVKLERTAETEWLFQLFEQVHSYAQRVSGSVSDKIQLYIHPSEAPNAFAIGHRTIAVTMGLCQMNVEHIKGVLAHEFGHIAHGDSDLTLGINVSNSILLLITYALYLIVTLIAIVVAFLSSNLGTLIQRILGTIVLLVFTIWVKIGVLMQYAMSRKDEYKADEFAGYCGYAYHLRDALYNLDPSTQRSSFLSTLVSTHPDTVNRIEALDQFISANYRVKA